MNPPTDARQLRSWQATDPSVAWGWGLLGVGAIVGFVPFIGFVVYLIGLPLLLCAQVLAVVGICRGKIIGGTLLTIGIWVVAPVVYLLIPWVSTALFVGAATYEEEEQDEPSWVDTELAGEKSKWTFADPAPKGEAAQEEEGPFSPWITERGGTVGPDNGESPASLTLTEQRAWTNKAGKEMKAALTALNKVDGRWVGTFIKYGGGQYDYLIGNLSEDDIKLVKELLAADPETDEAQRKETDEWLEKQKKALNGL